MEAFDTQPKMNLIKCWNESTKGSLLAQIKEFPGVVITSGDTCFKRSITRKNPLDGESMNRYTIVELAEGFLDRDGNVYGMASHSFTSEKLFNK